MARVLIGTSGWHYDSWRGPFFPRDCRSRTSFNIIASQFSTAELNGVFYRTPTPEAVKAGAADRQGFCLRLEGGQIHHPLETPLAEFCEQPRTFGEPAVAARRQGRTDPASTATEFVGRRRPAQFLLQVAFEESAYSSIPASQLVCPTHPAATRRAEHRALHLGPSRCAGAVEAHRRFRLCPGHGPSGRYKGRYGADALAGWAGRIRSWKKQGCDVFVYFDNDQKSAAPADALRLKIPRLRRRLIAGSDAWNHTPH